MDGAHTNPDWRELVTEALLELDEKKLPAKIEAAQEAVFRRSEEVPRTDGEQQALRDALNSLQALRGILRSRNHEPREGSGEQRAKS